MKLIDQIIQKCNKYFAGHQPHFLFLLIIGLIIYLASKVPYLNIIFASEGGLVFFIFSAILILRLNIKEVIFLVLIFLSLIPYFLIIKNYEVAEKFGNIVYFIMVFGFAKSFLAYLLTIKN